MSLFGMFSSATAKTETNKTAKPTKKVSKKIATSTTPTASRTSAAARPPKTRTSGSILGRTVGSNFSIPDGFVPHSSSFPRYQGDGTQMDVNTTSIDIVFCMDCTGSMQSYIDEGKRSISLIAKEVEKSENSEVRFGYVAYRDHPPQDKTFITLCHDFTDKAANMTKIAGAFNARGGGDGPEAVASGLHESLNFPWRDEAVKIVVLIADAPPHGIGANGDGFPQGEPNGIDPVKVAKDMASQGIVLYVIACEPSLSNYKNAHDVLEGLAQITEGRYLPLTAASLLPPVIVGGAGEEASLKKLEEMVETHANQLQAEGVEDDEIENRVQKLLDSVQAEAKQVEITDLWGGNYQRENIDRVYNASSLTEAISDFKSLAQPCMQMQQQEVSVSRCKASSVAPKMMKRWKKRM